MAAARIYPLMSTCKDSATDFSIEGICKQLRIAFEDSVQKDKAINRLNTLRKRSRPFSELLLELDRLLLGAGGHGWSDDVKKRYIRVAVNKTLARSSSNARKQPTSQGHKCVFTKVTVYRSRISRTAWWSSNASRPSPPMITEVLIWAHR
ncbi:uncharacterized protein V1513DRAFT_249709 [Lipomyces chichibuensis]|uniref:uncharacterized protein n=1 Tax=Lipomyces chichibuensis TaxID=1546026 RepID=UPI003343F4F6